VDGDAGELTDVDCVGVVDVEVAPAEVGTPVGVELADVGVELADVGLCDTDVLCVGDADVELSVGEELADVGVAVGLVLEDGDADVVLEDGDADVVLEDGDADVVLEDGDGDVVLEVGDGDVVLELGDAEVLEDGDDDGETLGDADAVGLDDWNWIDNIEPEICWSFTNALTCMVAASLLVTDTVHRPSGSVVHPCWDSTPGASAVKLTSTLPMSTPVESFTIAVSTTCVPTSANNDAAAKDDC